MKSFLLAMAALAAAGCATTGGATDDSYRALGTEPFWSIEIANGRMTYDSPEGGFNVSAPRVRETGDGRRYETQRIILDIWAEECSDGMSDRGYADTVRAQVDGRTLTGCGGAILAPASLADTSWTIVEIDDQPVSGDIYAMQFTADRISGQAGCNRFSGGYTVDGPTLTPGAIMATRMACPEPRMTHERRALQVLGGPVEIGHPDGDTLLLTGNSGSLRLRRAI